MSFSQRFELLRRPEINNLLLCSLRGVEREALRVDHNTGKISQKPHPSAVGSSLTHSSITTDYSEALMEFITEPQASIPALMTQLEETLIYTIQNLDDELLWSNSMPCQLGSDADIPIAQYGSSHSGRMKTLYREGLGLRYGRAMQCIAGVHFNISLPDALWAQLRQHELSTLTLQDYKTRGYMSMVRNFRRHFWILLYLMGAAPAVCRSFVRNQPHRLSALHEGHTLVAPNGTTLRMGNLGYQSSAQDEITVCYNELDSYIGELCKAILSPHQAYEKIGLFNAKDEYQQLNTGLLQIENEFYSTIRPKQTTRRGETQLRALAERGIEYIEVRCLDLNPFSALGIEAEQLYFVEAFLLACLLDDSPETEIEEYQEIQSNQAAIVYHGRDPSLLLRRAGSEVGAVDWAGQIVDKAMACAGLLDNAMGVENYSASVNIMKQRLTDKSLLPSSRILDVLTDGKMSYQAWTMEQSRRHTQSLREKSLPAEVAERLKRVAEESIGAQKRLEASQAGTFAEYLQDYYRQYQQLAKER
jgi:glutamate--cysteine ligase